MRKRIKTAIGLLAAVLLTGAVPVKAAEKPDLYLQAEYAKESDKDIEAQCMVKNGEGITNGKVRILYDADKVKLVSSEGGEGLGDAMCEINDCLKGNKKEGEMVVAFASSGSIEKEGAILELKFQVQEGVKDGDKINFTVKPEKIAGESGNFNLKDAVLEFEVGKKDSQTSQPTDNGQDEDKDEDTDKKPGTSTDKEKDSDKGTSNRKPGGVKTGDETEIIKYAVLGVGTGLIILICVATSIMKKKKKNQ